MSTAQTGKRLRLAFISPVFLFPNDAGGKIRTTNILRGLKNSAFEITLLSPATPAQVNTWQAALQGVCDHFISWSAKSLPRWQRVGDLLGSLPVNVAADRQPAALACVAQTLAEQVFDVVVYDFVHAAVLQPTRDTGATVCFTHNVEAEIFARHAQQKDAGFQAAVMRWVWAKQYRKMLAFERSALARFTRVIAVSDRDAKYFREQYQLPAVAAIPTGVDLDFFAWQKPAPSLQATQASTVVFTGSMNWAANIDGVNFFLDEVWPLIQAQRPGAQFVVVGRDAPAALLERARTCKNVRFTGFVDDVRPYAYAAHAFVIPLRVGGGTRIKAFEAMAMGCPVVSTAIGIEGLAVTPDTHYLLADRAADFAAAVLRLFDDAALAETLSSAARALVEAQFGHRVAAQVFEQICLDAYATKAQTKTALNA